MTTEYKSAFKEAHERAAKELRVLTRVCKRRSQEWKKDHD